MIYEQSLHSKSIIEFSLMTFFPRISDATALRGGKKRKNARANGKKLIRISSHKLMAEFVKSYKPTDNCIATP